LWCDWSSTNDWRTGRFDAPTRQHQSTRGQNVNQTTKRITQFAVIVSLLLLATACTAGSDSFSGTKPAGLLAGLWHGIIAPITLIWGIFDKSVKVYEVMNTGWWYDLGFLIGVGALCGGGSQTARRV
jgi:hypothetical protein